jgi:hypothetical protein
MLKMKMITGQLQVEDLGLRLMDLCTNPLARAFSSNNPPD